MPWRAAARCGPGAARDPMSPEAFRLALAGLDLPAGLGWGVCGLADPSALHPLEVPAVARAVPARQAEFAGGRVAARAAMLRLGHDPAPVPMLADRSPAWPEGLAGSISHSDGLCVAVVSGTGAFRALGIDLEPAAPLDHALHDEITRPDEATGADPLALRRRFSAKEAVYKAQFPITGCVFGFHALHVDLLTGIARFADHPESASLPDYLRESTLVFRQWDVQGMILSFCAIPA